MIFHILKIFFWIFLISVLDIIWISILESQLFKVSVGGLDDVAVLQNFKEGAARSRALQSQIKSIKKKLYEVESNFRTSA